MKSFSLYWKLVNWSTYFMSAMVIIEGGSVDKEIRDLLDMIPSDKVMDVCKRYAREDSEVRSVLTYMRGAQFKENMAELETSEEFEKLAVVAETYNIDAYALTTKLNSVLDMFPDKDSTDDEDISDSEIADRKPTQEEGVLGLLKDVLQVIPIEEIKQAYRYKLRTNPQFKLFEQGLMKKLLSGEIKSYLQPVLRSKPIQNTIKDLQLMDVPFEEIKELVQKLFVDFFDLGTSIETEVQELLEMVPYDRVIEVCMEYAIGDVQVKTFLSYLCGDHFKKNVAELKKSNEFYNLAKAAKSLHIDAYSLANKFIYALNALPNRGNFQHPLFNRKKRSPGDGLPGLVKEALEITPLHDIKQAYRYKLENNPQLKVFEQSLMDRILSGEVRQYLEPLINSKPFQETIRDLEEMGLPLEQIQEFIELKLVEFFDLDKSVGRTTTATSINF